MTHLIAPGAREISYGIHAGKFLARCGEIIDICDDAPYGVPECETCRELDEQDAADILAIQQMQAQPLPPLRRFQSTDGYRRKGSRR